MTTHARREPANGYSPIADYALIGNQRACALVGRDGSIDWCCAPRLDGAAVFGALLDARRGGHWRIAPAGAAFVRRGYVGASAVLETELRGTGGMLQLTDFLRIDEDGDSDAQTDADALLRLLRCTDGEVEVECEWAPRPNYARDAVRIERDGGNFVAHSETARLTLAGLPDGVPVEVRDDALHARLRLRAGDSAVLVCAWGGADAAALVRDAWRLRDATAEWWERWIAACRFEPRDRRRRELVTRSGMVLKILTSGRTGAMAAAATASLPEEIGGVRNWDYRYCWVRDAGMTTRAFATLGHVEDGVRFLHFLESAARRGDDPHHVQVMYGLGGELEMPERELDHLDGYRGSRPVRVGNDAARQRQLDVYGELIESAYELLQLEAGIPDDLWHWVQGIAGRVCDVWRERGAGIWEIRSGERHFTHEKVMCWVALDRALRIAESEGWRVDTERWTRECRAIRRAVLEQGFSTRRNSFVQAFDHDALDAANLLIPIVGFLPADDPRVLGTLEATRRGLTENGLVYRYRVEEADDGIEGGEGAFVVCTLWLGEALALAGRVDEAEEIFAGVAGRVNDVGLLPEQIDPASGAFLGNFPQAFSHIGLIDTAYVLDFIERHGVEGIPHGVMGLWKTPAYEPE